MSHLNWTAKMLIVAAACATIPGCSQTEFSSGSAAARSSAKTQASGNALPSGDAVTTAVSTVVAPDAPVETAEPAAAPTSPALDQTPPVDDPDSVATQTPAAPAPQPPAAAPMPPAAMPPAAPAPAPAAPVVQQLQLSCDQLHDPAQAVWNVKTTGGIAPQVQLTGHMCPLATGNLTVLFIVDWSGSMQTNDPVVSGSCGRLQAMQEITNYIKSNASSAVTVQEALVPFASDVETAGIVTASSPTAFAAKLTQASICRASGGTNYIAALTKAQDMLKNVTGRSVIYFISDGGPTVTAGGVNRPEGDAGVIADTYAAAKALKAAIPSLTINSLLLGTNVGGAVTVMNTVATDANHVRVAANASQLATEIVKFPAVTLDTASASALLNASGMAATPVKVGTLTADSVKASQWEFLTEKFTAPVTPLGTKSSSLTVTAKASDGSTEQAVITINVTDK